MSSGNSDRWSIISRVVEKTTAEYITYGSRNGVHNLRHSLKMAALVLCEEITEEEQEYVLKIVAKRIETRRSQHPRKYSHL